MGHFMEVGIFRIGLNLTDFDCWRLTCIGIFVLNQEQLKNCLFPTKMGEAFVHLDEGDTSLN